MKRVTAALVLTALVAGCASSDREPAAGKDSALPATRPGEADPRIAYAAGISFGRRVRDQLREDGITIDNALLVRGVRDALDDRKPLYPDAELETAVLEVDMAVARKRSEKMYGTDPSFKKMADENLRHSREFLAQHAALAGVEVLPNGIQVRVIQPGAGRVLEGAKKVTANYEVQLADGTVVRASPKGKPDTIVVQKALPAVYEAVRGMRVGAKWEVTVPPELAYGLGGRPPFIGPNQALVYEIELLGVE